MSVISDALTRHLAGPPPTRVFVLWRRSASGAIAFLREDRLWGYVDTYLPEKAKQFGSTAELRWFQARTREAHAFQPGSVTLTVDLLNPFTAAYQSDRLVSGGSRP